MAAFSGIGLTGLFATSRAASPSHPLVQPGEPWSRVRLDEDPTAHAEMSALRDAAKRSGPGALRGAVLYSSSHPCSMCQAAADWVGIATMIYGGSATNAGPPRSCA